MLSDSQVQHIKKAPSLHGKGSAVLFIDDTGRVAPGVLLDFHTLGCRRLPSGRPQSLFSRAQRQEEPAKRGRRADSGSMVAAD